MSTKIENLINVLDSIQNLNDFIHSLEEAKLSLRDLDRYIYFEKNNYTRNLIYHNSMFELMTICWGPNQETPIHDHPDSEAYLLVVEGTLTETIYRPDSKTSCLTIVEEHTMEKGQSSLINDSVGYHKVRNNSNSNVISLNLYAKPIDKYFVYNKKNLKRLEKESSFYSKFGSLSKSQESLPV